MTPTTIAVTIALTLVVSAALSLEAMMRRDQRRRLADREPYTPRPFRESIAAYKTQRPPRRNHAPRPI